MSENHLKLGPVVVTKGKHRGRIGDYDDDELNRAIVYFGSFMLCKNYSLISYDNLRAVTTDDLFRRREEIISRIGFSSPKIALAKHIDLLCEYEFIGNILVDRMFRARFAGKSCRKSAFISHSSRDQQFAKWLAVDLENVGHKVWLDEWSIRAGESIPHEIAHGIQACDFVLVVLSPHAVKSRWVENEWHAKYWDEIQKGDVCVIPILFQKCDIPQLLKTKKYADFTRSYNDGFEELVFALNKHKSRKYQKKRKPK